MKHAIFDKWYKLEFWRFFLVGGGTWCEWVKLVCYLWMGRPVGQHLTLGGWVITEPLLVCKQSALVMPCTFLWIRSTAWNGENLCPAPNLHLRNGCLHNKHVELHMPNVTQIEVFEELRPKMKGGWWPGVLEATNKRAQDCVKAKSGCQSIGRDEMPAKAQMHESLAAGFNKMVLTNEYIHA